MGLASGGATALTDHLWRHDHGLSGIQEPVEDKQRARSVSAAPDSDALHHHGLPLATRLPPHHGRSNQRQKTLQRRRLCVHRCGPLGAWDHTRREHRIQHGARPHVTVVRGCRLHLLHHAAPVPRADGRLSGERAQGGQRQWGQRRVRMWHCVYGHSHKAVHRLRARAAQRGHGWQGLRGRQRRGALQAAQGLQGLGQGADTRDLVWKSCSSVSCLITWKRFSTRKAMVTQAVGDRRALARSFPARITISSDMMPARSC
mmetsp:Transcript_108460/g.350150  ORF Transcript_108460/g.350150 Transcript_108460/m.350150 type:complete len:259 (+) Transcript_108460:65-841(+)